MSRRALLRKGAVVGGTMVWATPAVQTFSSTALAQTNGTPSCQPEIETMSNGACIRTRYNEAEDCCDCIEERKAAGADAFTAALMCFMGGRCKFTDGTAIPC